MEYDTRIPAPGFSSMAFSCTCECFVMEGASVAAPSIAAGHDASHLTSSVWLPPTEPNIAAGPTPVRVVVKLDEIKVFNLLVQIRSVDRRDLPEVGEVPRELPGSPFNQTVAQLKHLFVSSKARFEGHAYCAAARVNTLQTS